MVEHYLDDNDQPGRPGSFSRGVYIRYIQRYLEFPPPEPLLVLVFQDLRTDPRTFYHRIFEFLGVETDFDPLPYHRTCNSASIWKNLFHRFLLRHPSWTRWIPPATRRGFFWGAQEPFFYPPIATALRERLGAFMPPGTNASVTF